MVVVREMRTDFSLLMNVMIIVISLKSPCINLIFHGHLGCPFDVKPKKCRSNICDSSVCTAYPDVICVFDD